MRLIYAIKSIFVSSFLMGSCAFSTPIVNPCAGDFALLNMIDRPTKADSACVVPYKQVLLETGYAYLNLNGGAGGQNYPQAQLRVGLPYANEFTILFPDYNLQTVAPRSGNNETVIGIKHEIGYNRHWLGSVEGLLSLPTGGGGFGSDKYGPAVNAIVDYTFNSALSLTFMFGLSYESLPASQGGQHFFSVNPDVVLTWQVLDKLQLLGEVYGQSRTSPKQGVGIDADLSVTYLVARMLEIDAVVGHSISGKLGGFNNYYGVGMSVLFG